jgi:dienelactone hydrolase
MHQATSNGGVRAALYASVFLGLALGSQAVMAGAASPEQSGEVQFTPGKDEAGLPEMFQLPAHRFTFRQQPVDTYSTTMAISRVTFPSPVETPHPANNTVHCEYFRPLTPGRHRAVVVLHILGGDFDLARLFSRTLAHHGVAALFLKMPYYGPRRDPQSSTRMVSSDIQATVAGMRQAVLDIRQATAWLASREEIDPDQLGVFGISLGGITGALAATAEPRLTNVCLMLAGGDIGQVAWASRELAPLRTRWQAEGGSKEEFFAQMKKVDPVTYARSVPGRRMLLINASHDELIPRACTESLWRAFGQPPIVWLDAGHYTAMWYLFDGLNRVVRFFQPPPNG